MSRHLYPHQHAGAEFLAGDEGHLLAGEMGTGKSLSSIEAARRRGAQRVLITCPAIVVSNWIRELRLAEFPLTGVDIRKAGKKGEGAPVGVLSVDWMRTPKAKAYCEGSWDVHIVDEAHYLGEPESARTLATYSRRIKSDKIMFLTGTPTPRHAGQLWTHINRSAPHRIDNMTYAQFTSRYCVTQMKVFGNMRQAQPVITGNNKAMIPELRERLRGWWLVQRREDVLKDLPGKFITQVELSPSKVDLRQIAEEIDPEVMEQIMFALEIGDARGLSLMDDSVARLRRLLAMAKVDGGVEYTDMVINGGGGPVSFWGWHVAPLKLACEKLRLKGHRVDMLSGETPQAKRDALIDAFQAGKLDALVCQIKAAGVGTTMTRGNRAIFLEESFVPADNAQAQDRHDRIGQTMLVQIDRLVLMGTIDEAVAAINERRLDEWRTLSAKAIQ